MSSPFPGMNPYLEEEKLWPVFQQQLAHSLYQMLLPNLVDRYRTRVLCREYRTEEPLFTSVLKIDHREHQIEIRSRTDDRPVTWIDWVNPANRLNAVSRKQLLEARQDALNLRTHVVLIDLVLQGNSPLQQVRDNEIKFDYSVGVTRFQQPNLVEFYYGTLPKRLPRFKIPLAGDDRDVIIDLQTVFQRAVDAMPAVSKIDYTKDPPVPLSDENRQWMDQLLKSENLRPC